MEQHHLKFDNQDCLITTVHNIENVIEVYLNPNNKLVTELMHLSDNRIKVYQYELAKYLEQRATIKDIKPKLKSLLVE